MSAVRGQWSVVRELETHHGHWLGRSNFRVKSNSDFLNYTFRRFP